MKQYISIFYWLEKIGERPIIDEIIGPFKSNEEASSFNNALLCMKQGGTWAEIHYLSPPEGE